jgi:hypothetical protein
MALELAPDEAEGVVDFRVVEAPRREQKLREPGASQGVVAKAPVPPGQVLHRREDAAASVVRRAADLPPVAAVVRQVVSRDPIRNDAGDVVVVAKPLDHSGVRAYYT